MKTFVKLMAVAAVMATTSSAFASVASLSRGMNATSVNCSSQFKGGRFASTNKDLVAQGTKSNTPVKATKGTRG